MSEALQLGAFELLGPLGRGGMATVHAGRHGPTGTRVAIKILRAEERPSPRKLALFRSEVEAVARLSHPGIIEILDYGSLPQEAEGRGLRAGLPYLVMEYASEGSLHDQGRPQDWGTLRSLLLGIFDALGHAHASGLLHRDLKPANILRCGPRDPRPGLKLADFGAVSAFRGRRSGSLLIGTPQYMAPEHRAGRWRDQGPETDLFSVGCVAWQLATGFVPTVLDAEGKPAGIGSFTPRISVPVGFEDWLRQLLEPAPRARPASAAAAALGLLQLGQPAALGDVRFVGADGVEAVPSSTFAETWVGLLSEHSSAGALPGDLPTVVRPVATSSEELVASGTTSHRSPVPLPATWRSSGVAAPLPALGGAGRALLSLRTVPLLGRELVQDRLWTRLHRAFTQRRPGLAVLRGPEGVGRSRLLQWLARAVGEVGAAEVLVLGRELEGASADPRSLLETLLRTWDLEGDALRVQVQRRLEHLSVGVEESVLDELCAALGPGAGGDPEAALARLVQALLRRRPVLLVVDDLRGGGAGMRLVRSLRAGLGDAERPLFTVLSVADEELESSSGLREELDLLDPHPLVLGPLEGSPARRLLTEVLGLHPSLSGRVIRGSGGLPAAMLGAVIAWSQQGALVLRDDKLDLAPGTPERLPSDMGEAWLRRVEAAEVGAGLFEEHELGVLELAAALGGAPVPGELPRVLEAAELPVPEGLDEALVSAGIARRGRDPTTWTFASPVLVDALAGRSRGAGRWAGLCARAAEAVAQRAEDPEREELLGQLLLAAGRPEDALPKLFDAAIHRAMAFEWGRAHHLLDQSLAAAEAKGMDVTSVEYGRLLGVQLTMFNNEGDSERVLRLSEELEAKARQHGWRLELGRAMSLRGSYILELGQMEEGARLMREALDVFDRDQDSFMVLQTWSRLATHAWMVQDLEQAERWYSEVEDMALDRSLPRFLADAISGRAGIAHARGQQHTARRLFERALSAEHDYPGRDSVPVQLGLVRLLLEQGELEEARRRVHAAETHAREALLVTSLGYALATRLRVMATLGELDGFEAVMGRLQHQLRLTKVAAPEVMWDLEETAAQLVSRGEMERAGVVTQVLGELEGA